LLREDGTCPNLCDRFRGGWRKRATVKAQPLDVAIGINPRDLPALDEQGAELRAKQSARARRGWRTRSR
jgi:hypothetical protein